MDIHEYLKLSVLHKASDLHISPGSPPILRINGDLILMTDQPVLNAEMTKSLLYNILTEEQKKLLEKKSELDFSIMSSNQATFRANVFYQVDGLAAVFRVIPIIIPTLEELKAPPVIKELLNLSNGIILITGPTGCGKSTTLAAMIEYINSTKSDHIITIEDPIEFKHIRKKSVISQRQVHRDAQNFSAALRAALREDPDVILVGEMRDLQTIRLALRAAETGHLVLATLHTGSAPHAVSRIIDVFPSGEKNIIKNLISQSLQGVICQTLVKAATGGRVAVYEIMLATTAIRNLIREDKISQMHSVMQTSFKLGMSTMENSFKELIENKIISPDAAQVSGFQRELFEKY